MAIGSRIDRSTHTQAQVLRLSEEEKRAREVENIFRVIRQEMGQDRTIYGQKLGDARHTFGLMDRDGNGFLSRDEFAMALKRMDFGLTDAQQTEVLDAVDTDGSGTVEYGEFLAQLQVGADGHQVSRLHLGGTAAAAANAEDVVASPAVLKVGPRRLSWTVGDDADESSSEDEQPQESAISPSQQLAAMSWDDDDERAHAPPTPPTFSVESSWGAAASAKRPVSPVSPLKMPIPPARSLRPLSTGAKGSSPAARPRRSSGASEPEHHDGIFVRSPEPPSPTPAVAPLGLVAVGLGVAIGLLVSGGGDGACGTKPCQHGGLCVPDAPQERFGGSVGSGFKCLCPHGFGGTVCELDHDECASYPCQHGGTCVESSALSTLDPTLAAQLRDAPVGGTYACICATGFSGNECEDVGLPGLPSAIQPWVHAITGALAMIPIANVERSHPAYPAAVFGAVMGCWLGLIPAAALMLLPRSRIVTPAVSAASGVLSSIFSLVAGVFFDLGAAVTYFCGALLIVLALKVGLFDPLSGHGKRRKGGSRGRGGSFTGAWRNQAQELVAAASTLALTRRKAWVDASVTGRARAKQHSPPATRPVAFDPDRQIWPDDFGSPDMGSSSVRRSSGGSGHGRVGAGAEANEGGSENDRTSAQVVLEYPGSLRKSEQHTASRSGSRSRSRSQDRGGQQRVPWGSSSPDVSSIRAPSLEEQEEEEEEARSRPGQQHEQSEQWGQEQARAQSPPRTGTAFGGLRERSRSRERSRRRQQPQQPSAAAAASAPARAALPRRYSSSAGHGNGQGSSRSNISSSSSRGNQPPSSAIASPVDELGRLSQLREIGLLSPAEFRQVKKKVLGRMV
eukprot:COSAG06_NODE_2011_length_7849_cov_3.030581_1_plen_849_part_00